MQSLAVLQGLFWGNYLGFFDFDELNIFAKKLK